MELTRPGVQGVHADAPPGPVLARVEIAAQAVVLDGDARNRVEFVAVTVEVVTEQRWRRSSSRG
jgi:hypothetical protein